MPIYLATQITNQEKEKEQKKGTEKIFSPIDFLSFFMDIDLKHTHAHTLEELNLILEKGKEVSKTDSQSGHIHLHEKSSKSHKMNSFP